MNPNLKVKLFPVNEYPQSLPCRRQLLRRVINLTILLGCLFNLNGLQAQQGIQDRIVVIKKQADSLLKAGQLPGIMIGILDEGNCYYFDFGYADRDKQESFGPNTVFEAGSITKTLTAYILESVLKEKGIRDTAAILVGLPYPLNAQKNLAGISFKSLLNHSSGLPRLPANLPQFGLQPYDNYTLDSLYRFLQLVRPGAGGNYLYSNLGVGLAGVLAQRLSGKSFGELMTQYIFGPFQMENMEQHPGYPRSVGYMNSDKVPYWHMNALYPAGGLTTNTRQLLRYLAVMARPKPPVDSALIRRLLTPTLQINPRLRVGRSWHMTDLDNLPRIYWHNGGTYGFSTFAAFAAEASKAVVVVVNQFNQNRYSDELGFFIMKKILEDS